MKTIDVREGDTWTMVDDGGLFQYRNKQWRGVYADTHESEMYWRSVGDRLVCEIDIPTAHAKGLLAAWGYTLTSAAKPEAKPNPSVCPDCQFTLSAPACNGEHQRKWDDLQAKRAKPEPLTFMDDLVERTEKPKPADVPVASELWGRIHTGSGTERKGER